MNKIEMLLDMIHEALNGNHDLLEFSFDFPAALADNYKEVEQENRVIAKLFNDDLVDACSWYDPYNTGDDYTIDEEEFRERAKIVYDKALLLAQSEIVLKTS